MLIIYSALSFVDVFYCCVCAQLLNRAQLFMTPWTASRQALLSMGFSRQKYLSGLPCPPPGDLPNPGFPHCRQILYRLSHQGSPRILEWVAYPSPGDLPNSGIELGSPALKGDSLPAELPGKNKGLHSFKNEFRVSLCRVSLVVVQNVSLAVLSSPCPFPRTLRALRSKEPGGASLYITETFLGYCLPAEGPIWPYSL